jgi:hypothetical protein
MNDYVIGAGAILTAGPNASIAVATLHAQTDSAIAGVVRAAVVDFESTSPEDLSRLVAIATGWNMHEVRDAFVAPLVARGACALVDVFSTLASAAGIDEIHLFARWLPDELLTAGLAQRGATIVAHPLEAIRQAALVCAHGITRLPAPVRAA